jgi:hypothetical protein
MPRRAKPIDTADYSALVVFMWADSAKPEQLDKMYGVLKTKVARGIARALMVRLGVRTGSIPQAYKRYVDRFMAIREIYERQRKKVEICPTCHRKY